MSLNGLQYNWVMVSVSCWSMEVHELCILIGVEDEILTQILFGIVEFSQRMAWAGSSSCSGPKISEGFSDEGVLSWVEFFVLAPCAQRELFIGFNSVFLLLFIAFAIHKFVSVSKIRENNHEQASQNWQGLVKVSFKHKATLAITGMYSLLYIGLCIWRIIVQGLVQKQWPGAIELAYTSVHGVAWIVFAAIVAHEKKFRPASHPNSLRSWWVINFILVLLFVISAIIRFVTRGNENYENVLLVDDVISLVTVPGYVFLFILAILGSTGLFVLKDIDSDLRDPLLNGTRKETLSSSQEKITAYTSAGFFSRLTFMWLNPLLKKGYESPLQLIDIPSLAPFDNAKTLFDRFKSKWNSEDQHPVRKTLFRVFWPNLLLTAILALTKVCVMYVGPLLIQSFQSYTSSEDRDLYEGYSLVLILLVAKVIEVLSSHQYNFHCQRLGTLLRASLITHIYRKGLRLSSAARQDHGVGQIVNYMAVDCQQLSDMMLQLNYVWMMPVQVGVALVILYRILGISTTFGVICMFLIIGFVSWRNNANKKYQINLMRMRDERMKATNEVLNFMRVIKMQAWEEQFLSRVISLREIEYCWLAKFMYSLGANISILWSTTTFLSIVTFTSCILMGVNLTSGKVFTAISIFKILEEPIRSFPQALISLTQAMVSLDRLDRYMVSKEIDFSAIERLPPDQDIAVSIENGNFCWDEQESKPTLRDINIEVKKGALVAIVGTVGSGKSSLLSSVLGEMPKLSGTIKVSGSTGYVSQSAWIQNATIQENIMFGMPMESERYQNVIRVCSLEKDMEMMEFGDKTEIGERGINLSGGQKQRIQLARAIYQDSDIYLLDDIFSAVDAHTGSEIYRECIRGAISQKTILLVTHQVDFLHGADLILVMRDGVIVQSGKYNDLLGLGTDFEVLVAAHDEAMGLVENKSVSQPCGGFRQEDNKPSEAEIHNGLDKEEIALSRLGSGKLRASSSSSEIKPGTDRLIEDEQRETGQVSFKVYWLYMTNAYGWYMVLALLLVQTLWQGTQLGSDYWLAYETSQSSFNPAVFVEVYVGLSAGTWLFIVLRTVIITLFGLKTTQIFFKQMMESIFHAPMSFFDTTPSGRILSRSSSDQSTLDIMLPFMLGLAISMYFTGLSILVVSIQTVWPIVFLVMPLIWLDVWYQRYFISSSRELTRLDQITKAPVLLHFSESIAGFITIRCFNKQDKFAQVNIDRVNSNLRMDFHNYSANEWFGCRIEMLGVIFLCASSLCLVTLPSSIVDPELVGLSLSYGLSLNSLLFFSAWLTCVIENKMVSVERIRQFTTIPSEAAWTIPDCAPPANWPNEGNIELRNLQVRYRPNTPLILKGLSLRIKGGEKVGVVGRTGSGKSTFVQALFRIVEPAGGLMLIDKIDICSLGLHDVRSRFGIIPQEPVLFEGTIRTNIDPLGQYSDAEIWKSLERCQLADVVSSKSEKLDFPVLDSGENWSVGQRQLICLGRVMLKRSRILFMDEATASVDAQTDGVIQKIIREDFASCTIISIAHRIPTVMDCDQVLVIDAGLVKEFDKPSRLLERPSLFGALVQEYATRTLDT